MPTISLSELPPPPAGKTGFPWTMSSDPISQTQLPRISIVTPSFNQAASIEETIRSVLLQQYPNLEYIVIDGGSTDGSGEIIRRYAPWLSDWIGEPDHGQTDALNKGFARATGDWVAWINSDDRYLPNAFARVSTAIESAPASVGLVFGDLELMLDNMTRVIGYPTQTTRLLDALAFPFQQTCFFKHSVLKKMGVLDVSLHYAMDADILLRLMANADWLYVPMALASFRVQGETKTNTSEEKFAHEMLILLERVLANRAAYPKLQALTESELRARFYRRASKHYYMGNQFRASLALIGQAMKLDPREIFSIAQDEGIGWLVRRLVPPMVYRQISAWYRTKRTE